MTAKEFIQKKNIVTDYVEGFTDRNGFLHIPLELLLTEYAESLQLPQSCVIGQSEQISLSEKCPRTGKMCDLLCCGRCKAM